MATAIEKDIKKLNGFLEQAEALTNSELDVETLRDLLNQSRLMQDKYYKKSNRTDDVFEVIKLSERIYQAIFNKLYLFVRTNEAKNAPAEQKDKKIIKKIIKDQITTINEIIDFYQYFYKFNFIDAYTGTSKEKLQSCLQEAYNALNFINKISNKLKTATDELDIYECYKSTRFNEKIINRSKEFIEIYRICSNN